MVVTFYEWRSREISWRNEESGITEESTGLPIILVKKKNENTRWFCVGYRKLNNVTQKDSYVPTCMADTFDSLNGR